MLGDGIGPSTSEWTSSPMRVALVLPLFSGWRWNFPNWHGAQSVSGIFWFVRWRPDTSSCEIIFRMVWWFMWPNRWCQVSRDVRRPACCAESMRLAELMGAVCGSRSSRYRVLPVRFPVSMRSSPRKKETWSSVNRASSPEFVAAPIEKRLVPRPGT